VRRASDNTEQDIGFDANGDLDTSALATFCSGTNGFVKTWYDQSGNGNDATQATTTAQPKIYDSGTGVVTENGYPALQYDGSNDSLATGSVAFSQPNMFHLVANATVTNDFYFDGGAASESRLAVYSSTTLNLRAGITFLPVVGSGFVSNQSLYYALFNGSSSAAAYNGASALTGNAGTNSMTALTIGSDGAGANSLTGTMQELILYNTSDDSNRAGIETNINDYYTIY
jgi:hypothetical protein